MARVDLANRKAGPGAEFLLRRNALGIRSLLWVTSTHAGSHAATAEVPHKADQIAAAPRTEQGAIERNRLYDRPLVKGGTYLFCLRAILLFDLDTPSFRPALPTSAARRARSVKDGASAPPNRWACP